MFGSGSNASDKLAAALEAYHRDYASRIKANDNLDAQKAAALIKEATEIVRKSGLGRALGRTIVEHVKHWPAWQKHDNFEAGFPATEIFAQETKTERGKEVVGVLFTYKGERYGIRFTDNGIGSFPDGEMYNNGTVDFVVKDDTVLGLDISRDVGGEFGAGDWTWGTGLYAFKPGPWTKHLLEIEAHIEEYSRQQSRQWQERDVIKRAQNIKL
jgi:hypothetical protein